MLYLGINLHRFFRLWFVACFHVWNGVFGSRTGRIDRSRIISGWTEGVQLMVQGEKRRFWIPAKLTYGENPPPNAPAGTLVFDVELIRFTD